MEYITVVAMVVTVLLIPWVVQLIKTEAISGKVAAWLAVILSIIAGVIAALVAGIPATPEAWITCILAFVGGVQLAYTLFKSVGITNKWLEALLNVQLPKGDK